MARSPLPSPQSRIHDFWHTVREEGFTVTLEKAFPDTTARAVSDVAQLARAFRPELVVPASPTIWLGREVGRTIGTGSLVPCDVATFSFPAPVEELCPGLEKIVLVQDVVDETVIRQALQSAYIGECVVGVAAFLDLRETPIAETRIPVRAVHRLSAPSALLDASPLES